MKLGFTLFSINMAAYWIGRAFGTLTFDSLTPFNPTYDIMRLQLPTTEKKARASLDGGVRN